MKKPTSGKKVTRMKLVLARQQEEQRKVIVKQAFHSFYYLLAGIAIGIALVLGAAL